MSAGLHTGLDHPKLTRVNRFLGEVWANERG
jgi:hypothetical protein